MLVAVPIFGARISPRFDCAPCLLFFDLGEGITLDRREEAIGHLQWRMRIRLVVDRGVNVLLCGGIRRCDYLFLVNSGIDVRAGLVGMVDDVLAAFMRGEIIQMERERFLNASWGNRRRRRSSDRRRS